MTHDWRTTISLGGFTAGDEMRWETVKSWQTFTNYFDEAVRLDAVTYCESPKLLLDLYEEFNIDTMDILVGNRSEYQSSISEKRIAEQLVNYYQDRKLIVRLKERKVIHSKLYRLEHADDTVTLITGSPNLSFNSWTNQTNDVVVFYTQAGSELDSQFRQWIDDHRVYADTVLIEDLVEELESVDDDEERERKIELWISGRDTSLTERGEIHAEGNEQLDDVTTEVNRLTGTGTDDADETVTAIDGNGNANEDTQNEPRSGTVKIEETPTTANSSHREDERGEDEIASPITTAATDDFRIRLSTRPYESNYVNQLETGLKQRDATIGDNAITTPIRAYTSYLEDQYDIPLMRISPEDRRVTLQSGTEHRSITDDLSPTPAALNAALTNLEDYFETVDRWGTTNQPTAVKAHMYEAILFGLWAPFVNLYAEELFKRNVTLDNALQYLYIFGDSDAGKDIHTEFLLRLLSDGLVTTGAEADNTGKRSIRVLKDLDTPSPYIVSDISRGKIKDLKSVLANFWQQWTPGNDINYPTIIFTSNDSRPNAWFRNRTKMVYFDVTFPSNPEDEHWQAAQENLNLIMNERNHIFAWVAQQMLIDQPYQESNQTIGDVRDILLDFYTTAERAVPEYFPRQPANREYNIGKRKWRTAFDRGDITFEHRKNRLIAEFNMEQYEVHSYKKTLPTRMRPEKNGRKLIIKNPDAFVTWIDRAVDNNGLFGRLNGLLR